MKESYKYLINRYLYIRFISSQRGKCCTHGISLFRFWDGCDCGNLAKPTVGNRRHHRTNSPLLLFAFGLVRVALFGFLVRFRFALGFTFGALALFPLFLQLRLLDD
jgi:hypothetical protein